MKKKSKRQDGESIVKTKALQKILKAFVKNADSINKLADKYSDLQKMIREKNYGFYRDVSKFNNDMTKLYSGKK